MSSTPPPGSTPLVVVMGVSGSGKSVVGAALAQRLRVPFADADDFHPPANIAKMTAGEALDDRDRKPWLAAIGTWLADQDAEGGVIACSALKWKYRDQLRHRGLRAAANQQLRHHAPRVVFLHLDGSREVIARRQASRPGHFMPTSLLTSQFETLQRLAPDEAGLVIDVDQSVDVIVQQFVDQSAPVATPKEISS